MISITYVTRYHYGADKAKIRSYRLPDCLEYLPSHNY